MLLGKILRGFAEGCVMRGTASILLLLILQLSLGMAFIEPCSAEDDSATKESEKQSKALVVFVYDKTCRISCSVVRPQIMDLQEQYADKVQFVYLDVSQDTREEARKTAQALGISRFLKDCEQWYPAVGIFSSKRKLVKQLLGTRPKKDYVSAIEKAIESKK